ncbi:Sel1 repeat family protein [Rhodovastum atsumiense]|nr:hypothetical protein [Rhodovastum atsumiense]CAH2603999.1 Sel1 repeat family protein [Rhodovastum atsumiense]
MQSRADAPPPSPRPHTNGAAGSHGPGLNGHATSLGQIAARRLALTLAAEGKLTAAEQAGVMLRDGLGGPPDPEGALTHFEIAAAGGIVSAMLAAGAMLTAGNLVPVDHARAAQWYRTAAEAGDTEGMLAWAEAMRSGRGVPADPKQSEHWLRVAATAGSPEAAERLGVMLATSGGHRTETLELLRAATAAGRPKAAFELGHLLWGDGDSDEIFAALSIAAAAGHPEGTLWLGFCHAQGVGVREHPTTAFLYFEKAALLGVTRAKHQTGKCYEEGLGVGRNITKASGWYNEAARDGNAAAARRYAYLRDIYPVLTARKGEERVARRDYENALRIGPSAKNKAETAQLMLTSRDAVIVARGKEVLSEIARSGKAADLRLVANVALAAKLATEAGTWMRRATALGDAEAARELAAHLDAGRIKPADPGEAARVRRTAEESWRSEPGRGGSRGR